MGETVCYTCGKTMDFKKAQNGHFVPRQYLSVRYDEVNCHAQCLTADSCLKLASGIYKSIEDICIGDKLSAFDEKDYKPLISEVEHIKTFIPGTLYEVEMEDGSRFYCTGNHRVVADGKWLSIEDMLHRGGTYDIMEL